eukprot:1149871-Pelagomonas_calceolata.AAC.2
MGNTVAENMSREVHLVFILFGCFVSEGIARALKHTIQQPRPLETCESLGGWVNAGSSLGYRIVASGCCRSGLFMLAQKFLRELASMRVTH